MIGIFNNKTSKTDLTLYNGEYILDSICTKFEVTEELNGEYSLDVVFTINNSIDKKAYDLMVNDSLLKVDEEYGTEYFRIAKVTKDKRKYEIFARQISISETLKMFCEDVRPTNLNGTGALNWILSKARGSNWFEVSSDITTTNTAYYIRKSVYEAIFGGDNSFIETWGGEIYRRGFRLEINRRVGEDRGVSIRSGKNLKGIEEKTDIDNLVTSIYPMGFDGITIDEKFINSRYINNYSSVYPAEIKFSDIKVKGENDEEGFNTLAEAQAELKKRANALFEEDRVDILTASYTIDFATLEQAEGYKDYSILEKTWIGDLVNVYEENLGIDIKVRVTKRVYDGLKKKRKSTTLSNKDINIKPPSLNQVLKELEKMDSTEEVLNLAKSQASALIKSGMKNSFVIVKENEILIMDTKDINTATKVWRFNNAGLGYSKTGYFGEYGLAITQDGQIVADFMSTGVLKALNDVSWINLDSGLFSFANGKLKFDGANLSFDGKIINSNGVFGIEVDKGGLLLKTDGENVGGIRSTKFFNNSFINGVSILNTIKGDYIDFGFANVDTFNNDYKMTSMFRITKTALEETGNFIGLQSYYDFIIKNSKRLLFSSNNAEYSHEMYNTVTSHLGIFGDNGLFLGYKIGNDKETVLEISETPNEFGSQAFLSKQLSMQGKNITSAGDIYKNADNTRYFHEGWCGSIEQIAKRVSNLNVSYDTGFYAFASGTNGSPVTSGTVVHIKHNNVGVCTQLCIEVGTGKLYTRATNNNGTTWTAWAEK